MAREPKAPKERRSMLRDPLTWIATTLGAAVLALVIWLVLISHS